MFRYWIAWQCMANDGILNANTYTLDYIDSVGCPYDFFNHVWVTL